MDTIDGRIQLRVIANCNSSSTERNIHVGRKADTPISFAINVFKCSGGGVKIYKPGNGELSVIKQGIGSNGPRSAPGSFSYEKSVGHRMYTHGNSFSHRSGEIICQHDHR